MKKFFQTFLFTFCFLLSVSVFGQTPIVAPTPPVQENEDIIRISSSLVQTDFIVLDKDGKQVRDLKESDVVILQDGKPQKIANFSYVSFNSPNNVSDGTTVKQKTGKNAPPVPPVPARSNQAGRLITFVVDDGNCNASITGMSATRDALTKFVSGEMQPNDRIAIYQTKGGSNLLQQYTSNKEQLLRTIKKIRFLSPVFGCGAGIFDAATSDYTIKATGTGSKVFESETDKQTRKDGEDFNRNNQVVGTIGVLNFVVERLKPVAGRKMVFILSDGFKIPAGSRALEAVRGITDNASRSSVVFYTVDTRGVVIPGFIGAQDNLLPDDTSKVADERSDLLQATRNGLAYLAHSTGGRFIKEDNFFDKQIEEAVNLENGYYLIAYQPENETFKSKDFHKIEVKVVNSNLRVLSRTGFYGIEDKPRKTKQKTADSPLFQALASPLQESGIDVRLTTLYKNDVKQGNFVRALLYLNGRDLSLIDEPGGTKKLSLDVVAVTLDEKNKVIGEFNRAHTIHIPQEAVPIVLQNGLVYTADVPIEKTGAYSLRIVVRDNSSNRLASASDFVEVQDVKKGGFFMSGLIITGNGADGTPAFPTAASVEKAISPVTYVSNSAVRQYRAGDTLFYAYTIYNAKIDSAAKIPNLTAQLRLYRDGNLVIEGKEQPIELNNQTDLTRIQNSGSLRVTPGVQAGDYVLQIVVKDAAANKTTSQWIDFEVVK